YGQPTVARIRAVRERLEASPPLVGGAPAQPGRGPSVRLIEWDKDAESRVAAAAVYAHSTGPWHSSGDPGPILDALLAGRRNRRDRAPRALEHAVYLFEI